jgi:hypothetical protein
MASTEIENVDPAATVDQINKIAASRALNRRSFLTALGMTGAAAGAGLMSGCTSTSTVPITTAGVGIGETNILNFLLNIKYLEATIYAYLVNGVDLPSSVTVGSGAVIGAPSALTVTGTTANTITQQVIDLLNEIYYDEVNQVSFLRSILGSSLVARPALNLAAFGTITATGAITTSTIPALTIGRLLEDVAVTAFANAIPGLTTSNATYAAQIQATESFHAGALRLLSISNSTLAPYLSSGDGLDVPPADLGSPAAAAAGPTAAGGFFASTGGSVASANTTEGLSYLRTTSQVLAILYGALNTSLSSVVPASAGTSSGGFFPKGVNGAINTI